LRDPQRLDAVAPDAVVNAERQFVAVGVVGQSIELERATVAHGWPAGLVR
jgi:transcriptional antiterminator Rof (Rho-off)